MAGKREALDALQALQALADTIHSTEYWRTRGLYPQDRWKAAWEARSDALSKLIKIAAKMPMSDAGRAALEAKPNE